MSEYPQTAVERAMKIQEVILRAVAKRITWWQAAEILGMRTAACGAGRSATKSMDTTVCLIGGEASPVPSGCL